jgi:hypothetical protein
MVSPDPKKHLRDGGASRHKLQLVSEEAAARFMPAGKPDLPPRQLSIWNWLQKFHHVLRLFCLTDRQRQIFTQWQLSTSHAPN